MEKRILGYGDAIELLASTVYKYAKSDILREQDEPALELRPVNLSEMGNMVACGGAASGPLVRRMFEPSISILTRADVGEENAQIQL